MKKTMLLSLIIASSNVLASCGGDTKDWPRITFDFEPESVETLSIYYERLENDYEYFLEDTLLLSDLENISEAMEIMSAYPYRAKCEKNYNEKDYCSRVIADFTFLDDSINNQRIQYYSYGISNGKVIFNNGEIHFIPGRIDAIYEEMKGQSNDN